MSYPSLHEIRSAADEYWSMWQQLLTQAPELRQVIGQHSATAIGWKVDGELSPLEAAVRVYELGDHLMLAPVNRERAILTVHKPGPVALDSLQDIKLMQRRPSKPDDPLGADSLDLIVPHGVPTQKQLEKTLSSVVATLEFERNDMHQWVSLRYNGHEFKLIDHTVWSVCVKEASRAG